MKPARFSYVRPRSLDEALALLAAHGDEAKVLAGGQSLVPAMNMRLARPAVLVDINGLEALDGVEVAGHVRLGALVRHTELASSPGVQAHLPIVAEAARHIGHRAIRNRGSLGGSLAHADPAAELPAALIACDASLVLSSPAGTRRVAAEAFFQGPYTTALQVDELLAEVNVPDLAGAGWGFAEVARRPGDFAIAGVAACLRGAAVRLAAFGVADTPIRLRTAETLLGAPSDWMPSIIAEAARAAASACEPVDDLHASADYRRHLLEVLVEQVLHAALARARGSMTQVGDASAAAARLSMAGAVEPLASAKALEPAASAGAVAGERAASTAQPSAPSPAQLASRVGIRLSVNGRMVEREVEPRRSLAEFLREDLRLTGTHLGCEHGVCGACTVLLDGQTVRSCLLFAAQMDGASVVTIEGLTPAAGLSPLQQAFRRHHALQCGFCTPGMIMTAHELLAADARPSRAAIREAIAGNLCMCTGYHTIVDAIEDVAQQVPHDH